MQLCGVDSPPIPQVREDEAADYQVLVAALAFLNGSQPDFAWIGFRRMQLISTEPSVHGCMA